MTVDRLRLAFGIVRLFEFGGVQRTCLRMARACARRGHEVTVFCSRFEGPAPEGVQVEVLPVRARTNHGVNLDFERALAQATRRLRPDLVVGFTKMRGLDLYYAGDPCLRERLESRKNRALTRLVPRYRSLLEQEAAVFGCGRDVGVLMVAHAEAEVYRRRYGTEVERFRFLPPHLDRRRLDAQLRRIEDDDSLREELGLAPRRRLLLTVGSNYRTKGVDRALRTVAYLRERGHRDLALVAVGEGKAAPLARLARWLGVEDALRLVGPRRDVARFYRAADLLVHPARVESAGAVLLEAMYCGLPVATVADCGFADHVERARAGAVLGGRYEQAGFDALVEAALGSDRRAEWRERGRRYTRAPEFDRFEEAAAQGIEDAARARQAARARD